MNEAVFLDGAEAAALAASGADLSEWSPVGSQACLLLDYCEPVADTHRLVDWLSRLSCPVIAVSALNDEVTAQSDVLVTSRTEALAVAEKVAANPVAATTLAQLLRVTESMPLMDALQVESLAYATLQSGAEYALWLEKNQAAEPFQPTDEGPAVLVERDGNAVRFELNRPSNRNAMSMEMRDGLNEALVAVLDDKSIEALHISGRGKCFSTGGDLTEFGLVPDPAMGHIIRSLSVPGRNLARCRARLGENALAHLHGGCIGSGIEFPAFAGRVTASSDAWFQLPEVGMGLIPGAGGCISIARRIGRQRTARLALSSKRINAKTALEWGLVDEIVN